MQAKIVDVPALKLVGSKINTGAFSPKIPQLWDRFVPRMSSIPNRSASGDTYGVCVCHDLDKGDVEEFEYMASVEVEEFAPEHEEFVRMEIPARRYALFTHRGDLAKLPETMAAISQSLAPQELDVDNSLMLELYGERFNPAHPDSEVDLLLPLKKKTEKQV